MIAPKISVIIPIYNTGNYLRRCLDSICGQTMQDIEIICVNDASSDNSLAILKGYANKDVRVKFIDFSENKGVSKARNAGIDAAQGEYIGFVDSDDYIDLDFYEKLYANALKSATDIIKAVTQNHFHQAMQPSALNTKILKHSAFFINEFFSAIYKRNFLNKYNIRFEENIITFEDTIFSLTTATLAKKIQLLNAPFYHYIINKNSKLKLYDAEKIESRLIACKFALNLLNTIDISMENYTDIVNYYICLLCNQYKKSCNSHTKKQVASFFVEHIYNSYKYKYHLTNEYGNKIISDLLNNLDMNTLYLANQQELLGSKIRLLRRVSC
jgi:glycosyltransferase involved in cell wall biosynthesis